MLQEDASIIVLLNLLFNDWKKKLERFGNIGWTIFSKWTDQMVYKTIDFELIVKRKVLQ
jgi:hypothetical protein